MKLIEESDVAKARVEDLLLDEKEHGPAKAKFRHVMQSSSEPEALQVATATPQVTRDTVVFTAQDSGILDDARAFHSGDSTNREQNCIQPTEGVPGAHPQQLIQLLKHCYGLTDGPRSGMRNERLCRHWPCKGYTQS